MMNDVPPKDDNDQSLIVRGLIITASLIAFIFSLGVLIGYTQTSVERGFAFSLKMVLVYGVTLSIIAVTLVTMVRKIRPLFAPRKDGRPLRETRTGRMQIMWLVLMPVSILSGILLSVYDVDIFLPTKSNVTVSPAFAIAAAIISVAIIYGYHKFYRSNVDEVELNAVFEAGYWCMNFYMFAMPVGWLFWSSGLLSEMPTWPIFWIVIFMFNGIFFWKKFR